MASPSPRLPDPRELLELATKVAGRAADLLLDGSHRHRTSVGTKSTATDMVTEMDRASEQLIVTELLAARPEDGILAEEGSARPGTSGLRWVIDPLDGTTNYLYGHPGYAISIAVEVDGETAVGVVHDPIHGDRFAAMRGGPATRNDQPIQVSTETELGSALIATGFAYAASERVAQAELLVRMIGSIRDIRRMGAAAVDLCSVACGRVDAYYERGLNHWDLAAGALIARAAGATVGELDDGTVVAAPPALYGPLRGAIVAALDA
jgi:myo-inositol-1(or 4)-monophosphatase